METKPPFPNRRLSASQLDAFGRDGTLFPLPLLDTADVASYRARVPALLDDAGLTRDSGYLTQLHLYLDWVRELATLPPLLDRIEDLFGPDLLVHSTSLFVKHPAVNGQIAWHQDGYLLGLERPELVTAWIALSPATPANGCLQVLPGSHRDGCHPHRTRVGSDVSLLRSGLELVEAVDAEAALDVCLRPGEMALHHADLVHGSRSNRGDGPRIGLAVRFVPPALRQRAPHFPVLLARGEDRIGSFEHYELPAGNDAAQAIASSRRLMEQTMRARGLASR